MSDNIVTPIFSQQVKEYQKAGFYLVPLAAGQKYPTAKGWNEPGNLIAPDDPVPEGLEGIGIAHLQSRTVALDIDHQLEAVKYLRDQGIDVPGLFEHGVQIRSGRLNHAKLLYRLPDHIPGKISATLTGEKDGKRFDIFQFRNATAGGKTLQDVMPPTIHPDTRAPYTWVGDFHRLPVLPAALLGVWDQLLAKDNSPRSEQTEAGEISWSPNELRSALSQIDPDIDYESWVQIGMALHSTGDQDLIDLFDEWSAEGSKYKGRHEIEAKWRSFSEDTDRPIVTLRTLFKEARDAGWRGYRPDASEIFKPVPDVSGYFTDALSAIVQAEPTRWLVRGLVPEESVGFLYGPPSTYKSFIAIDLAARMALGVDFYGHTMLEPKRIGIISPETALGATAMRLKGWMQENRPEFQLSDDTISQCLRDNLFITDTSARLHESSALTQLYQAINDHKLDFLIVDTLAANALFEENSNLDAAQLLANIRAVAGHCSVLIVHHTPKSNDSVLRGASALAGGADYTLAIEKLDPEASERPHGMDWNDEETELSPAPAGSPQQSRLATLRHAKDPKSGQRMEEITFDLKVVKISGQLDDYGELPTTLVPRKASVATYNKQLLSEDKLLEKYLNHSDSARMLVEALWSYWSDLDDESPELATGLTREELFRLFRRVYLDVKTKHMRPPVKDKVVRRAFSRAIDGLIERFGGKVLLVAVDDTGGGEPMVSYRPGPKLIKHKSRGLPDYLT